MIIRVARGFRWWHVLMGVTIVIASLPLWLDAVSPPPVYYQTLPIEVLDQAVAAGQPLHTRSTRCNDRPYAVPYEYSRLLVNVQTGEQTLLASGLNVARAGCMVLDNVSPVVPATTTPGRYVMEGTLIEDGWYRRITVPWSTTAFDVVAP